MILDSREYRIVHILGHVEIQNHLGQFVVSGDTEAEAIKELTDIRTSWAKQIA